ncbi:MAG: transglycosylase SLT domain-containing protein [Christensenellales bacterium]
MGRPDAVSNTNDYGIMQINRCNFDYLQNMGLDHLHTPTTSKPES